jgi:hypothetical protein
MASAVWADPGRPILWQPLPSRSGSRFSDVGCGEQREPHRSRLFYEFAIDAVRTSPHPTGLIGHYVNYRKQISPKNQLIPQAQFGLYAVSNRYPQKLTQFLRPTGIAGVYQLNWGSDSIRLIVLTQIGPEPKNDLWHLFSHQRDQVERACRRYHPHDQTRGTLVLQRLIEAYQLEYPDMAYTFEQFSKEFVAEHLNLLTPDEVLKRFPADEVLKRFSADEKLKDLSADERLKDLSADERLKDLSPDDLVDHLSPDVLQRLLERIEQQKKN